MKKSLAIILIVATAVFFTGCDKMNEIPYHEKGSDVTLSSSKTTVAPVLADSASEVVNFSWTSPKYAQDSSKYKFVVEIDSSGRNFAKETTKTVTGKLTTELTGRELNNILLNFGFNPGTAYDVDVRLKSSYGKWFDRNLQYIFRQIQFVVVAVR